MPKPICKPKMVNNPIVSPCHNRKTGQDCPRRKQGCSADCPEWREYVERRNKFYDDRIRQKKHNDYEIEMTIKHKQKRR